MRPDLIAGVVALATASALLPLTVAVLRRGGVYDYPSSRSSHCSPTPRGAGAAQLVGLGSAWAAIGWVPFPGLLAPVAFSFIGLLDDLRAQRAITRLVFQLIIGLGAAVVVLRPSPFTLSTFVTIVAITVFFVVAVNSANFMDGINGISALHGIVVGVTFWWLLTDAESDWAPIASALVGTSIAFLPWNWGRRARLFLGDSGSYLLGSLLASFVVAALMAGVAPLVALAPIIIYLADVFWTLLKRLASRQSLLTPHRDHVYQRLVQTGLSHPQVASLVATFSLAAAGVAMATHLMVLPAPISTLVLLLLVSSYLVLPRLRRRI